MAEPSETLPIPRSSAEWWELKFDIEQRKYVDWVNQVVVSHQGPMIEQFRVCFDLGADESAIIDRWMEFAAARKVHGLELGADESVIIDLCYLP